jgi:hypothetical protein
MYWIDYSSNRYSHAHAAEQQQKTTQLREDGIASAQITTSMAAWKR